MEKDTKVMVVITHYNDSRIFNCLDSLFVQTRKPDKVLIADGGSKIKLQKDINKYIEDKKEYQFSVLLGRCIDTRRQVISKMIQDIDIIAWIDSDEIGFGDWLEKLIEPIEKGEFDFTGGFMIPICYKNKASAFLSKLESRDLTDESYIAMGNSAWSTEIFKKIGNFDDSSVSKDTDKDNVSGSYHISDDFDINLRAIKAGFKGKIVEAYTLHNQSHIDTYRKVLKYFYGQYVRTAMAYFKHKESPSKFTKASKNINHPFEGFLLILKFLALIRGWKEWNLLKK